MSPPSESTCNLERQGKVRASCRVQGTLAEGTACQTTLRRRGDELQRLIRSAHLSRPENYFSIYQSGCNFSCRKCHSWEFSQFADGEWMSPEDIAATCREYERHVTLVEPRERCTAWHAHLSCRCCGACVLRGERPEQCPGILSPEQVLLSPQGYGPARNIIGFTGGDLTCRPEFYVRCTELIKASTHLWVLIETNGYGLTDENLDVLARTGVDGFWLDIKAFDPQAHTWLTGAGNADILTLPGRMLERGFVLEVLSLYIPGVVEADQLGAIAGLLADADRAIPFTILAFFPEFLMRKHRGPNAQEMTDAYERARETGLENVRLGNLGVFLHGDDDYRYLRERCGSDAF